MSKKETTIFDAETFNLSSEEFERIEKMLGRKPNMLELELLSVLWLEHSGYQNSLKWLNILPFKGKNVVIEAGKENAGAVDIGDGLVCVMNIESHNHPCAVQPRFGVAAGLRVVTRKIFSMGARPVAFFNSLRFGNSRRDTTKWLFDKVLHGIADFERGFGIPYIGGEIFFNNAFNSNPIVNNMVVGIAKHEDLISNVAKGKGNLIAVIGAPTDREGVEREILIDENKTDNEINDFSLTGLRNFDVEVKLYKLIQEFVKQKNVIGIQHVGAQGIIGAVIKMAAAGKSGIELYVDDVPKTDDNLSPRDILISETWGRILICFSPEHSEDIKQLTKEHDVEFGILGKVTDNMQFKLLSEEKILAKFPVNYNVFGSDNILVEEEFVHEKSDSTHYKVEDIEEPDHYPKIIRQLITSLNIASKKWIYKN